jgi:hypothetical protein
MPTTTKTLYVYSIAQASPSTCTVPATSVAAIDAAAQAGGWYTLPNGYRINWDNVSLYLFQ